MRKPRKFAEGGTSTREQQLQKYLEEKKAAQRAAAEARQKAAADKDAAAAKRREGIMAGERAKATEREKTSAAKDAEASKRREATMAKERAMAAEKQKAAAAKEAAVKEFSAQKELKVEARRKAAEAKEAAKVKYAAEQSAQKEARAEARRKADQAKEAAKEKFVAERSAREDAAVEAKRQAGLKAEEAKAKFAQERAAKAPSAPARPAGISAIPQSIAEQQALFDKRIAQAAALPPEQRAKFAEQFQRAAASGDPSTVRPQAPVRTPAPQSASKGPPIMPVFNPADNLTMPPQVKAGAVSPVPPPPRSTMAPAPTAAKTTFSNPAVAGGVFNAFQKAGVPPAQVAGYTKAALQQGKSAGTQTFGGRTSPPAQPTMQQRAATSGMAPKPGFVTVKPAAGVPPPPVAPKMKKGGAVKAYAKGGKVSSASSRGDGIAQRGKTKGRIC